MEDKTPSLTSQDLAADHAPLSEAGVPFTSAPCLAQDEMATIAVCADPDGTLIELIELHMEKWSAP